MYMNVHTECIYRINEEILNDDRRFDFITKKVEKVERNLDQLIYLISFSVVWDCAKYAGSIPSLTFNPNGLENIRSCPHLT